MATPVLPPAILEQHNRAALGGFTGRHKCRVSDRAFGYVDIKIWIVEKTERKLFAQQPAHGYIKPRFADATAAHKPDDDFRTLLTAKLIDTGVDRLAARSGTLRCSTPQHLASMPTTRQTSLASIAANRCTPCRQSRYFAQQPGDDLLVETKTDFLERSPIGMP